MRSARESFAMSASEILPSRRCFCSTRRSEGDSSERQASRPRPPPPPPLPSEEPPENARRPDDDAPDDDECSAVALSLRRARSSGEAPGHPGGQARSAPVRGAASSAARAGWALVAGGRRESSRAPCSTGATKAAAALERAHKFPAVAGAGRASGAARLAAGWCASSSADTARSSCGAPPVRGAIGEMPLAQQPPADLSPFALPLRALADPFPLDTAWRMRA